MKSLIWHPTGPSDARLVIVILYYKTDKTDIGVRQLMGLIYSTAVRLRIWEGEFECNRDDAPEDYV